MAISRLLLLLALLFAPALASAGLTAAEDQLFCSEQTLLQTQYFSPFYESHKPVTGCVSSEFGNDNSLVHVVRLAQPPTTKSVILNIAEYERSSSQLHLLLDTPSPVAWKITLKGELQKSSLTCHIYLPAGSKVSTSNMPCTTETVSDAPFGRASSSDAQLEAWARTRFGGLTVLANVADGANRVSILLSDTESAYPSRCVLNASGELERFSEAVQAYRFSKQPAHGCLHSELAGTQAADLHILELDDPAATDVYLTLSPPRQLHKSGQDLRRSLILYLRSRHRGVVWYLQSQGLQGDLKIVYDASQSEVRNHSLSPKQNLTLERAEPFQGGYDQLWKRATASEGVSPIAYIKMEKANIISLVVPPFMSSQDSKKTELVKVSSRPNGNVNGNTLEGARQSIVRVMLKHCSQSNTVIAIPTAVLNKLLVKDMTLLDQSCQATKNSSHWVLRSPSTSCGSLNSFKGDHTMFVNSVVVTFLPSSVLASETLEIPFSCRFQSGLGLIPQEALDQEDEDGDYAYDDGDYEEEYSDHYDDEFAYSGNSLTQWGSGEEMYKMRVDQKSRNLLTEPFESADVAVGDELTVQTDFETRASLNLAIDSCWISDNLLRERSREFLIKEGCPTSPNVSLLSSATKSSSSPSFTFRVSESHLRRFPRMYISCIMGLCSSGSSAQANTAECVDAAVACAQKTLPAPAALQVTSRGPLRVHRSLEDSDYGQRLPAATFSTIATHRNPDGEEDSGQGVRSSQHVVMVGVPAEIAVAISLASFIIGAGLTGLLCCVHHRKKEPAKMVRVNADTTLDGSELQSMISSSLQPNANHSVASPSNGSAAGATVTTPLKDDMESIEA